MWIFQRCAAYVRECSIPFWVSVLVLVTFYCVWWYAAWIYCAISSVGPFPGTLFDCIYWLLHYFDAVQNTFSAYLITLMMSRIGFPVINSIHFHFILSVGLTFFRLVSVGLILIMTWFMGSLFWILGARGGCMLDCEVRGPRFKPQLGQKFWSRFLLHAHPWEQ